MRRSTFMLMLIAVLALGACGRTDSSSAPSSQPGGSATVGALQISGAWVRAAGAMGGMGGDSMATPGAMSGGMGEMGGATGAAYLMIRNSGAADRLVKVSSDVAGTVELHNVERDGDVMKMRPVEGIDVPANGEAVLQPGGFHIMLIGLKHDLKPGDKVKLALQFQQAGMLNVDAEVRQ